MLESRLAALTELTPRQFHISSNPPFGVGLVLFGQENQHTSEDCLEEFIMQQDIVRNCKPGIWTLRSREPKSIHEDAGDCHRESILY